MREPHTVHPYARAMTGPAARSTRPPAGQALLDDPEAGRRAFAAALASGPAAAEALLAGGTAISYDARTREDWELNTLFMDPDAYVFHPGDPAAGGPEFRGEYVGVEGYIKAMMEFGQGWSNLSVEAGPVKVLNSRLALSVMNWVAEGRGSGVRMEWGAVGRFEFREGLIVDQTFWWSMEEARQDLGDAVPNDWRPARG